MREPGTEEAAIAAEIARIRSLPSEALRRRWQAVFGRKPPAVLSKDLLGRIIAHHLQEQTFGGLDRDSLTFLDSLARQGGPVPINLSAKQFCRGEPGTMCLSRIPMARSHGNTVDPRTARGSGSVGSRFREMLQ
jgi:hypothetical protein